MNTLSIFNPRFSSDLFDLFDETMNCNFPKTNNAKLPAVDVLETKDNYILEMELCGLSEKDIEQNKKERVLSVSSKKAEQKEEKKQTSTEEANSKGGTAEEKHYLLKERKTISFNRQFTLPQDIDGEKISATFTNGLLTITIPKRPEAEQKSILINVA